MSNSKRRLVDTDGVADYLNTTPRWVRRGVAEGRLPFLKLGALVRFDLDAIDAWLDNDCARPRNRQDLWIGVSRGVGVTS